ncbi:hypothetical protein [uncultured Microscilla sp.]|uniref:hypothetical protein n=1 Tax=uncultured Microscilla sp. TaxID=432653 RepID=UPI0026257D04|nr:hypothetical protein [uncultured Microscilla sp.]
MALTYDIEKDAFYQKGVKKGREEGVKEGREEGIKKGREEGVKEGREEGIKKGREEGIKKGREEGVKEGREEGKKEEKTALILGLLKSGKITLQEIAYLTKITIAEVQKIADQIEENTQKKHP